MKPTPEGATPSGGDHTSANNFRSVPGTVAKARSRSTCTPSAGESFHVQRWASIPPFSWDGICDCQPLPNASAKLPLDATICCACAALMVAAARPPSTTSHGPNPTLLRANQNADRPKAIPTNPHTAENGANDAPRIFGIDSMNAPGPSVAPETR